MGLTFIILAVTIVLFVLNRLRMDLVAMLSLLALLLLNLVTVGEALAGFSEPTVVIIAALFVVGAGLFQTGVASTLGSWMARVAGADEVRTIAVVMVVVAVLSAFMSSTGAVAVLLPVVVSVARGAKTSPSKLLMPLAFGALIGGMLTLIGTPPNIIVSGELVNLGYAPFGFFEFTPMGLLALILGIGYMILAGRRLLPERSGRVVASRATRFENAPTLDELSETYQLAENLYRLRVRRISELVGHTLKESELGQRYDVNVLEVQSWPERQAEPSPVKKATPETVFDEYDILCVQGARDDVARLCREQDLGVRPAHEVNRRLLSNEIGLAEVLIRQQSSLVGRTLAEVRFRNRYGVTVLAIMRRGEPLHDDMTTTPLQFGDTLLVQAPWSRIERITAEINDFVVVNLPREMAEQRHTPRHARRAIAIVLAMLVVMVFGLLPTVTAVLLAATAMVLSGCLRIDDVYSTVNWESVVLIAAMLPMATALQKSGGVQAVADSLTATLGLFGPLAVMAGLYLLTTFFSQFISNTATTVLVAPIAGQAAFAMGVEPHAFLMMVAVAASAAFATPIASPVNTLILGPAGYNFADFAKIGIPLQLLLLALALLAIPLLFPL